MPKNIKDQASTSFSLVSQMMGASLLSISFITFQMGAVLSAIVFIGVYIFVLYLLNIFTEAVHYTQSRSYMEVTTKICGKKMAILLNVCIIVSFYGFCTGYVIISANSVVSFIQNVGKYSFNTYLAKALIAFVLIFPLCLIKSMGVLSKVSSISSFIILITVVSIVAIFFVKLDARQICKVDGKDVLYKIQAFPQSSPFITILTFLMYIPSIQSNFGCHNGIPSLLNDLKGPPIFKKKILKVSLGIAITGASIFYALVGYFGAAMFGDQIQSNIFINFAKCNLLYFNILALLYAIVVIISFPLVVFPIKETLLQIFGLTMDTTKGYLVSVIISFIFVTLAFALAAVYENIVVIFGIFASLSGFIYVFCLPIIFAIQLPRLREQNRHLDEVPDSEQMVDPIIVPILSNFMSVDRARALSIKMFGMDNPDQTNISDTETKQDRGISFLKTRTVSIINTPDGPTYRRTFSQNSSNIVADAAAAVYEASEEGQIQLAIEEAQPVYETNTSDEKKVDVSKVRKSIGWTAVGVSAMVCTVGVVMNVINMINSFK
ncbi:Amino acid transporter family protein [Spironucleus salmonicida]|uniref:Amino acid transporter family protein n=1 Tax=Spironucleus salmonicida TaxID=348837 RepID=V6M386_9EUKA|nr:Amino acid transporter family protein [Spironucleus salmonicida]|eukprot:EST47734.1 Amino acid transporter family protein [Spironucleus salmonicida]